MAFPGNKRCNYDASSLQSDGRGILDSDDTCPPMTLHSGGIP